MQLIIPPGSHGNFIIVLVLRTQHRPFPQNVIVGEIDDWDFMEAEQQGLKSPLHVRKSLNIPSSLYTLRVTEKVTGLN